MATQSVLRLLSVLGRITFVFLFVITQLSVSFTFSASQAYAASSSRSLKIADTYSAVAEKHLANAEYDSAIKWFKLALSMVPDYARASEGLAEAEMKKSSEPADAEGSSVSSLEQSSPFLSITESTPSPRQTQTSQRASTRQTVYAQAPSYQPGSIRAVEQKWAAKFERLRENYQKELALLRTGERPISQSASRYDGAQSESSSVKALVQEDMQELRSEYERKISDLRDKYEDDLRERDRQINKREEHLRRYEDDMQRLEWQLSTLQEDLVYKEKELVRENKDLKSQISSYESKLDRLRRSSEDLEEINYEHEKKIRQADRILTTNAQLKDRIADLEIQLEELSSRSDVEDLEYDARVQSIAKDYKLQLAREKEKKLIQLEGLRRQIIELKKERPDANSFEKYQSQITTLKQELIEVKDKYDSQISRLRTEHQREIQRLKAQTPEGGAKDLKKQFTSEVRAYQNEIDELKARYEKEIRQKEKTLATRTADITRAERKIENLEAEMTQMKTAIKNAEGQRHDIEKENVSLRKRLATKDTIPNDVALAESRRVEENLREEIARLKKDLGKQKSEYEARLIQLKSERRDAEDKLKEQLAVDKEKYLDEVSLLNAQIDRLQRSGSTKTDRVSEEKVGFLREELKDLKRTYEKRLADQEKLFKAKIAGSNTAEKELAGAYAKIKELEKDLVAEKEYYDEEIARTKADYQAIAANKDSEFESQMGKLKMSEANVERLQRSLKKLQKELSFAQTEALDNDKKAARYQKDAAKYEKDLKDSRLAAETLERELDQAGRKVKSIEKEAEQFKRSYDESLTTIKGLEGRLKNTGEKLKSLQRLSEKEMGTLKEKIKNLEADIAQIVQKKDRQIKEKDDRIAELEAKRNDALAEIGSLRQSLEELQEVSSLEKKSLEDDIKTAEGQIKSITAEKETLKKESQRTIDELEEVRAQNMAEIDDLNGKLVQAQKALEAKSELQNRVEMLNRELSDLSRIKDDIDGIVLSSKTGVPDAKKVFDDYENQISGLKDEIADLTEAKTKLEEENAGAMKNFEKAEKEYRDLIAGYKKSLDVSKGKTKDDRMILEKEMRNLESKIAELEEDKNAAISDYQSVLKDLEAERRNHERSVNDYQKKIGALRSDIEDQENLKNEIAALKKELALLSTGKKISPVEYAAKETQIKELKKEYSRSITEFENKIRTMKKEYTEKEKGLLGEIAALEKDMQKAEETLNAAETDSQRDIDRQKKIIAQYEDIIESQEFEIEELRGPTAPGGEVSDLKKKLIDREKTLKEKVNSLEKTLIELERSKAKNEKLSDDKIGKLENLNDQYKKELEDYRELESKYDDILRENKKLDFKTQLLQKQVKEEAQKAAQLSPKLSEKEREIQKVSSENKKLKERLTDLDDEITALKKKRDQDRVELNSKIKSLEELLGQYRKKAKTYEAESPKMRQDEADIQKMKSEIENLNRKIADAESEVKAKEADHRELERKYGDILRENKKLDFKTQLLQKQVSEESKKAAQLSPKLSEKEREIQKVSSENKKLKEQLTDLDDEIATLKKKRDQDRKKLSSKITSLEELLSQYRKKAKAYEDKSPDSRDEADIQKMKDEIESLRQKIAAAQEQMRRDENEYQQKIAQEREKYQQKIDLLKKSKKAMEKAFQQKSGEIKSKAAQRERDLNRQAQLRLEREAEQKYLTQIRDLKKEISHLKSTELKSQKKIEHAPAEPAAIK